MGYNTNITICNDNLGDYERNPTRFTRIITQAAATLNETEEWGVTVHRADHADYTQLIAAGHNTSTKLFTGYYLPPIHTDEGKIALLKKWADSLGYNITKKPERHV